jgi:plasmid stability protein
MTRVMLDCRKMLSERNCSLSIAGTEDEVIDAGADHAVAKHGHADNAELRELIRAGLAVAEPSMA